MRLGGSTILVVPCFNEAERLESQRFLDYVVDIEDISFLFVNDGSTDATGELIDRLSSASDRIHVLHLESNCGKAEAVRRGILWCSEKDHDFMGYWDADLSTPLTEVTRVLAPLLDASATDIATAARIKLVGRRIERNPFRHYSGRAFATAVSIMFGVQMYDTQCGAKLFRNSEEVRQIFSEPFMTKWVFDVELLVRFSRCAGKSIEANLVEVPLFAWRDVGGSKMKFKDFVKAPFELLRIHFAYFGSS